MFQTERPFLGPADRLPTRPTPSIHSTLPHCSVPFLALTSSQKKQTNVKGPRLNDTGPSLLAGPKSLGSSARHRPSSPESASPWYCTVVFHLTPISPAVYPKGTLSLPVSLQPAPSQPHRPVCTWNTHTHTHTQREREREQQPGNSFQPQPRSLPGDRPLPSSGPRGMSRRRSCHVVSVCHVVCVEPACLPCASSPQLGPGLAVELYENAG
ncbi:hypothetical protein VTJ83DRAFT_4522 [Remersonia thermophila]|uniref:Uncharacterized protein n=1 Tax=Remersonia thermophila TaxID=72144 RepID=A0ABR4DA89_9PEZI